MEKQIKKTKIIILLLSMIAMMSNVAIVTALPQIQGHFSNIANIEFYSKLLLTLPSLSIALLSPILGHFIYMFGQKKATIVALLLFSYLGSVGLYIEDISTLLISRFLLGIAVAMLMIVSTSLIGELFHGKERDKFIGIQGAFISLGGVLFVLMSGVLSDVDWRYTFGIYFVGILLLPLVVVNLKEKISLDVSIQSLDTSKTKLINILILAFLVMLLFYILPTQIPFLLSEKYNASSLFTGCVIALIFISNAIGAILFQKLKERYSNVAIYLMGVSIVALGLIAIYFIPNKFLFFPISVAFGIGGGLLMVNVSSWLLSRSNDENRIKNSAYLTSALFLGQFFSPIVFQPMVQILGRDEFFITLGLSIIFIVLITFFKRR